MHGEAMGWDPAVLRKYNTTGHFRLLSQLRSELKASPLVRPKAGESVGEVNRSRSLIRAIAEKAAATRQRRASKSDVIDSASPAGSGEMAAEPEQAVPN
jgi:hypothetical protein